MQENVNLTRLQEKSIVLVPKKRAKMPELKF